MGSSRGDRPSHAAYILGSVSYDSADFTRSSENFSYSAVSQLPKWRDRVEKNNTDLQTARQPTIDIGSLLNHPRELANFVLGYEGNPFGNQPGTHDGWLFRPRGMYQLVGREQYQEAQSQMLQLGELAGLDFLTLPDALRDAKISAKIINRQSLVLLVDRDRYRSWRMTFNESRVIMDGELQFRRGNQRVVL